MQRSFLDSQAAGGAGSPEVIQRTPPSEWSQGVHSVQDRPGKCLHMPSQASGGRPVLHKRQSSRESASGTSS